MYNVQYLLFCLAMFTAFAETTELELVVLPLAMGDEDPNDDKDDKDEDEEDEDEVDFSEDLDDEDGTEKEETE